MAPARALSLRGRVRSRRGSLSIALVAVVLTTLGSLPFAAHLGALPSPGAIGYSHLVDDPAAYLNGTLNDTAPGFYLSTVVIQANTTIWVNLLNNGGTTHTFSLYNETNQIISTTPMPSPSQLNQTWAAQTSPGPNVWVPAGHVANFTINLPVPGVYEVISLYPYQFQAGFEISLHVLPSGSATQQYAFTNTTSSLTFSPSVLSIAANIPVVFEVTAAASGHTFTLDGCSNDSLIVTGVALPTNDACLGASPYPNAIVNLAINNQGQTYSSAPVILKPGIYWFFCAIPGHFQAGMWGHVYVGILPQPAGVTPQVESVIQDGYLAVMGIVVGGAAFLILMGQNEKDPVPDPSPSH